MAIFKCKICGGALELNGKETVATCQYCGTKQTLPRLDDERRANLYDRANHFRRNNDFDKAMGMYEHILSEDTTDAEAYWSIILCRYGIEYVEDPATRRRVPTVNRAQYTSIFDDEDYKSAVANAVGAQREIYEAEAAVINEIQKGILAISQKEEPFDIFICYKETDASGRRTQDSALATELYHELTREGFKVFFSRITLEDKLGVAYEPYIFAALNSAKVMVVLGTRSEHFNAVWVKNEWSRYLALIKNGAKKTLIPAYKDMDPYDLPEEFSHLQALDMSRLGFMTDLVHAIKKMVGKKEAPAPVRTHEATSAATAVNVAPLFKRMYMALEDGEFERADSFCEQILNIEPENARGYLGKLLAECQVSNEAALRDYKFPFDGSCNYQKILRFGDEELKRTLAEYLEHINTRNRLAQLEETYGIIKQKMESARTEQAYKEVAQYLEALGDYKDAADLKAQCLVAAEEAKKAAEEARLEAIYVSGTQQLKNALEHRSLRGLRGGIQKLSQIPDYKDAKEQTAKAEVILQKIERALKKRAKRIKIISAIMIGIVILVAVFAILLVNVFIPRSKYNKAVALMEEGKYEEAIAAFKELKDHLNSEKKIEECETAILDAYYSHAESLMKEGKYDEAIEVFESLNGYRDSEDKPTEIYDLVYDNAIELMRQKKYEEAIPLFEWLGTYKHSHNRIVECEAGIKERDYQQAITLMANGEYVAAMEIFRSLGAYKYSTTKLKECQDALDEIEYQKALALMEEEKYGEAIPIFISILGYRDSQAKLAQCETLKSYKALYENAIQLLTKGKTDAALAEFYALGTYKDSKEKADSLLAAKYANAISLMEQGKYSEAQAEFNVLATSYSYLDSADKAEECRIAILNIRYDEACALMAAGKYSEAYTKFGALNNHRDSADKAEECRIAILQGYYDQAVALMNEGKYDEAISAFEALGEFGDSKEKIQETLMLKYNRAVVLTEAGEYIDAFEMFISLDTFYNSREKANEIYLQYTSQKLMSMTVGDTIFLGKYEQDSNDNGEEFIEWIILDIKDGKALLISKYVLENKPYNETSNVYSWRASTLRTWLNNEFLNTAFDENLQALISTTTVSADKNPDYPDVTQGLSSEDKVFLISYDEASKYFSTDDQRVANATAYAITQGVNVASDNASCNWWLRTLGSNTRSVTYVKNNGTLRPIGIYDRSNGCGVRPAMWVSIAP